MSANVLFCHINSSCRELVPVNFGIEFTDGVSRMSAPVLPCPPDAPRGFPPFTSPNKGVLR